MFSGLSGFARSESTEIFEVVSEVRDHLIKVHNIPLLFLCNILLTLVIFA